MSIENAATGAHDVPGAIRIIDTHSVIIAPAESFTPYMFAAPITITVRLRQKAFLFRDAPNGSAKEYSFDDMPIASEALMLSGSAALVEHVLKAVIIAARDFLYIVKGFREAVNFTSRQ